MKKFLSAAFPAIVLLVCIAAVWSAASAAANSEFILPGIPATFAALGKVLSEGKFYLSYLLTLARSLAAFAVSFALAFAAAFLSYKVRGASRFIRPIVAIVRALPTVAVVLLLLFWTNSQVAPIVVSSLVLFPTAYTNLDNALSGVDKELVEMCDCFGVSRKDKVKKVIIPAVLPSAYSAAGSGVSLGIKLMVAAEVLSSTANSIGYMMNGAKAYFETGRLVALVMVTVVTGLAVESAFGALSKRAGRRS